MLDQDFTLDPSQKEMGSSLLTTIETILSFHEDLHNKKVYNGKAIDDVKREFHEPLPLYGKDLQDIISDVVEKVLPHSTLNIGPYFHAYVMSCGNHAGLIGAIFSSYLNQNATKYHLGPASSELEQITLAWIKEFMGLPSGSEGVLVSGGSAANLHCLTVARNEFIGVEEIKKNGLFNTKPLILYASSEVHHCIIKSVHLLGLGENNVRQIKIKEDFTLDTADLVQEIEKDITSGNTPFCVVGSAGTINTGAVDPLDEIAEICRKFQMWFHVDGAYGALGAGIDSLKYIYKGIEEADSIAVDPHKWLYVPFEAGCALFKSERVLLNSFSQIPDYLSADRKSISGRDFMEYGFQLSRNDKALKIWTTIKAYGAEKIKYSILRDIEKAYYLAQLLGSKSYFEVFTVGPLSIVCYRIVDPGKKLNKEQLEKLNRNFLNYLASAGKVFISGTSLKGTFSLRSCFVNHRVQKKHINNTFKIMCEAALEIITNEKENGE